jgi:beta-glucanase (GH16 family)
MVSSSLAIVFFTLQFMHSMPVIFLFLVLFLASCSDTVIQPIEPANLVVEITLSETEPGLAIIQATAENTVEYQLRIGQEPEPVQVNNTGNFEHTFLQSGNFRIEVRAYGSSGRFIRKEQFLLVIIDDVSPDDGYSTPLFYEGYNLVWNDEFDGISVNTNDWVFETGTGCPHLCGWGNNELQYYRQQNAWVEDGILTIEARKEDFQGSNYTSARMKTQGKKSFKYGRIDIRAVLPKGQGIWPALWALGNNITSVSWPACGEIDIMEMIGGNGRENRVHGTVHWDFNGHVNAGGFYTLQSGTFADEYHVFTIIWDETHIRWFVNDNQYYVIDITPSHMTEFHQEFFFLFNVAVGGNWPGNPDATTIFPQRMKVDYIRVFQKTN